MAVPCAELVRGRPRVPARSHRHMRKRPLRFCHSDLERSSRRNLSVSSAAHAVLQNADHFDIGVDLAFDINYCIRRSQGIPRSAYLAYFFEAAGVVYPANCKKAQSAFFVVHHASSLCFLEAGAGRRLASARPNKSILSLLSSRLVVALSSGYLGPNVS